MTKPADELAADLALAKQAFQGLLDLCPPEDVTHWAPSTAQREAYIRLGEQTLEAIERLERAERRRVLGEGTDALVSVLPESLLSLVRHQIGPRREFIRSALDTLDPEGSALREFWTSGWSPDSRTLLSTFYEGLQQIYYLQERNPDNERIQEFAPDTAFEIVNSALLQFEPDAWLSRLQDINPIRTDKGNFQLPMQIRFRLEELYRAYIFGLWLCALALSRAVLEYAVEDNLYKFQIEREWSSPRRHKTLTELLQELEKHLPDYQDAMHRVRESGNEYLHPRRTPLSKAMLLQREATARSVIKDVVDVVEALYLAAGVS